MRKLVVLVISLSILVAGLYPLYAQDSGGISKISGLDIYQRALQAVTDKKYEQAVSADR